ncbi:hypothetical protein XANCAGTX0491_009812 [Xanthoria calcicola]
MSFINSVLSTIGGDDKQSQYAPQTQPPSQPSVQKVETKVDVKPKSTAVQSSILSAGQKRKAEEPLPAPKAKLVKEDQAQKQGNEAGVSAEFSTTKPIERPTVSTSKSALAVPYRGVSRPSPSSPSPASASPTTAPAKSGPPKKGSYAEIMARAATNNKPQLGVIKHKPKDTISAKKEIMMRKKGLLPNGKAVNKDARNNKSGRNSDSPVRSTENSKSPNLACKKAPPQPSYKGTAAPKPQPTYKGTMNMKPGSSIANTARRKDSKTDRSRSSSINPSRRDIEYESEEEEEDDELDGEENGYSDESDDMEAGAFEVEQEETAATRAARKEDEEQLRIEYQLKKEKEDRRKRLAAMAAKAPKPRY